MKVKVPHKTFPALNQVLRRLGDETLPRFAYAIARNQSRIKNILEALEKGQTPLPEFQAFTRDRIALCEEYADKGEDGQTIKRATPGARPGEGETFQIVERKEEFDAAIEKLREEYPSVIKDEEARRKDFVALLDEEVEFEPYQLKMSVCPEGILNGNDMTVLLECGILQWDIDDDDSPKPLEVVATVDEE